MCGGAGGLKVLLSTKRAAQQNKFGNHWFAKVILISIEQPEKSLRHKQKQERFTGSLIEVEMGSCGKVILHYPLVLLTVSRHSQKSNEIQKLK